MAKAASIRTVWVDQWQHSSGGEELTIGKSVKWSVMTPTQAELDEKVALFGPQAQSITDFEEHHNLIERTRSLTGSIVSIAWGLCTLVPSGDADPLSRSPEPGSGVFEARENAPKRPRVDPQYEVLGFLIGITESS